MREQNVTLRQGLNVPLCVRFTRRQTRTRIANRFKMRVGVTIESHSDRKCEICNGRRDNGNDVLWSRRAHFTERIHRDWNISEQGCEAYGGV